MEPAPPQNLFLYFLLPRQHFLCARWSTEVESVDEKVAHASVYTLIVVEDAYTPAEEIARGSVHVEPDTQLYHHHTPAVMRGNNRMCIEKKKLDVILVMDVSGTLALFSLLPRQRCKPAHITDYAMMLHHDSNVYFAIMDTKNKMFAAWLSVSV